MAIRILERVHVRGRGNVLVAEVSEALAGMIGRKLSFEGRLWLVVGTESFGHRTANGEWWRRVKQPVGLIVREL